MGERLPAHDGNVLFRLGRSISRLAFTFPPVGPGTGALALERRRLGWWRRREAARGALDSVDDPLVNGTQFVDQLARTALCALSAALSTATLTLERGGCIGALAPQLRIELQRAQVALGAQLLLCVHPSQELRLALRNPRCTALATARAASATTKSTAAVGTAAMGTAAEGATATSATLDGVRAQHEELEHVACSVRPCGRCICLGYEESEALVAAPAVVESLVAGALP